MSSLVKFEGLSGVGNESPHCYILTVDDFTFLLDCGLSNKFDKDYLLRLSKAAPRIDCVLLSFPDPLHIGAYPYLAAKCQLNCPVLATIPVHKNGQMFMYDWYQSHHNYEEFDVFDLDDVDKSFEIIKQVKYHQSVPMRGKGLGINVSAMPAGHMLGGAMWRITREGEDDILYAVDYNHKKERHLGGCELDKLFRPSLLITDSMCSSYTPERRRIRDQNLVGQLQATCRRGGNVLMATDTGGRTLEICHLLDQMWGTRESGMSAYTLAVLSNTGYHVVHHAKQMIEWMSEKLTKSFDLSRSNPFSFKNIKFCHSLADLSMLASPKVVLASFPDLESGYGRELFLQWAASSKNSIILTTNTARGSLAQRLIEDPKIGSLRLIEKKRVLLEGEELDEHLATVRSHKQMERIRESVIDSSSDEDGEELQLIESGKHDIVCLQEKSGTGVMRSRRHHPMYPYHEEKTRSDDYGEFIKLEDFESLKAATLEAQEAAVRKDGDVARTLDVIEITEPPSKCVSQEVNIRVNAEVLYVDFEGKTDGESAVKIIEAVSPSQIILVRGSPATLLSHSAALRTALPQTPIHTPSLGQVVEASATSEMQQIRMSDALLRSLTFHSTADGTEVAWVDGVTAFLTTKEGITAAENDEEETLMLELATGEELMDHETVLVNELRLGDFKQVLTKAGITAEFSAGILWCCNGTIALRKQEAGNIAVEGALTEDYFTIRELLYAQYALL